MPSQAAPAAPLRGADLPLSPRVGAGRSRRIFDDGLAGRYRTTVDGRILEANSKMVGILGYPSIAELLNQRATDLYWEPEDRRQMIVDLARQGAVAARSLRVRTADGAALWVLLSAALHCPPSGEPEIQGTCVDVGEWLRSVESAGDRASAASDVSPLEHQLQRAQQLEGVERLAGTVAHELNNLLTVITGWGELLSASDAEPRTAQAADEILRAARRAGALAADLYAASRREDATDGDDPAARPGVTSRRSDPRSARPASS